MGDRVRVALVDDDVALLDMVSTYLERDDVIDVDPFRDPRGALEAIDGDRHDIVVSDYEMPGMNGLSLLRGLRERGDDVPFIILTGRSREDVVIEALNAGVDAYLQKGRDVDALFAELRHTILRIVDGRRQRIALIEDMLNQRRAFESVSEGVFELDLSNGRVTCSEPLIGMVVSPDGGPPTDIDSWKGMIHPDDRAKARESFESQLVSGSYEHDARFRTMDGYRWFRVRGGVMERDDDGNPIRVIGTLSDDQGRRDDQEESARARMLLDRMLDAVPDMLSIQDRDLNVLYCNWNGFAAVPDERRCVGDKCHHALRGLDSACPDCRARGVLETGVPFREVVEVPEGRVLDLNILPLFGDDGRVEMFVEYVRDVTSSVRSEEDARRAHRMYESLLRHSDEGIMLVDSNGDVVDCNATAMGILGLGDVEGVDLCALHPMASREGLREHIRRIMEEGRFVLDAQHVRPDGRTVDVQIGISVADRPKGLLHCMIRDMTEVRMLERSLLKANEKLNLLSSITRHDVLNQTTVLDGFLNLLADAEGDERDVMLARAKRAVRKIDRQIAFTREYHDMGVKSPEWQSLRRTVRDAWGLTDHGAVALEVDVGEVSIFADPMLPKVFLNLIQNSIVHGRGVSTVSVTFDPEVRTIIVSDDGTGVATDVKERIFERAYGKGSGFGLFLSREILRITGIGIEEVGVPGEGAEFRMTVPAEALRLHKS